MDIRLDHEQQLLALLIADTPDASPYLTDVLSSAEDIDWDRFSALVDRHRVGGLVHAGLAKFPAVQPPVEVLNQLSGAVHRNAEKYLRSVKAATGLCAAFAQAGITCAALKGFGLAVRYYPQPSQREMIDIDLLVSADRFDDAEQIAIAQGFVRQYPKFDLSDRQRAAFKHLHNAFSFVRASDGTQLDLHWRMVQNPAMLPVIDRDWPTMLTMHDFAGRPVPMLRASLHFVYICVHGVKSGWARLKWLVDVDRVLRGLTEQDVIEALEAFAEHGLERIGAASMILSHRILGTPIPDAFRTMIAGCNADPLVKLELPMIFDALPAKPHRLSDWRYFIGRFHHALIMHTAPKYRRHALLREIARPLDLETVPLPPAALWALGIISPLLGAARAVKRVFGMGRS